jgi:hypothetical protein
MSSQFPHCRVYLTGDVVEAGAPTRVRLEPGTHRLSVIATDPAGKHSITATTRFTAKR